MPRIDDPTTDREAGSRDATLDTTRIDDTRIAAVRALVSPAVLLEELPVTPQVEATVERSRLDIGRVLRGQDDRLVAVVGPCSIHDHDQALQYARKLLPLARELAGELIVVMRVYFEKPRTTVGWKGYINDPRLDGSFRINEGLRPAASPSAGPAPHPSVGRAWNSRSRPWSGRLPTPAYGDTMSATCASGFSRHGVVQADNAHSSTVASRVGRPQAGGAARGVASAVVAPMTMQPNARPTEPHAASIHLLIPLMPYMSRPAPACGKAGWLPARPRHHLTARRS